MRDGQAVAASLEKDSVKGTGHYKTSLVAEAGRYQISAKAHDARHEATGMTNVTVRPVIAKINHPDLADSDDRITVEFNDVARCPSKHPQAAPPCLVSVVLVGEHGNVTMQYLGKFWEATADYKGLAQGTNTLTVHAQFINHFLGTETIPGGEVVSEPFTVNVTVVTGVFVPKGSNGPMSQPHAADRSAPGPALFAAIAVLGTAAVIARRKAE